MDTPRSTYQRVLLAILAAMALLFGALTAVNRARPGVLFRDTLLSISQEEDRTVYSGRVFGKDVTITAWQEEGSRFVTFQREDAMEDLCRVDCPDGTIDTDHCGPLPRITVIKNGEILFTGAYNNTGISPFTFFEEDGSPRWGISVQAYSGTDSRWHGYSFDEYSIVRFAYGPSLSSRGSWEIYGVMLFLTAIAAVNVAFPRRIFYLQHVLSVRDPEPTDLYMTVQQWSWPIAAALILIGYIVGLGTTG